MKKRSAPVTRTTTETDIALTFTIDGSGQYAIDTPVPFLTHMLELFSRHGMFDLTIKATGDVAIDYHHTVEDIGICLGQALRTHWETSRTYSATVRLPFPWMKLPRTPASTSGDGPFFPFRFRICPTRWAISIWNWLLNFSRHLSTTAPAICISVYSREKTRTIS